MTEADLAFVIALGGAVCGLIAVGVLLYELALHGVRRVQQAWRWIGAQKDAALNGIAESMR